MKSYATIILLFFAALTARGQAQVGLSMAYPLPSVPNLSLRCDTIFKVNKKPFLAAAQVFSLNVGVWAFDRYVLKGDYAYIDTKTMRNNLTKGFVWDNDGFSTNLLSHPYHGSLYFNAARSNGMSFWESAPYALGGSLMWELLMENEPPSINDLFCTTLGGVALGEVTFRLSSLMLDDSKHGAERVLRELCGAVISPMRAMNRMADGSMWRKRAVNSYQVEQRPFSLQASSGWRYLAQDNYMFKGDNGSFLDLLVQYGDAFENDIHRPFDYFSLRAMFNVGGNQPLVGSINAMGMIYGNTFDPLSDHTMTLGVFQHFDFYQSSEIRKSDVTPFEIAQAAAFGPGLMYKFPRLGNRIDLWYNIYANIILMGGSITDNFVVDNRNYNLGSGYSLKFQQNLTFRQKVSFFLGFEQYNLYTWKGYPNEPAPIPDNADKKHLNAQGNRSATSFTIVNPSLSIAVSPHLTVGIDPYFYARTTQYKYFDNVSFNTFETRLKLRYSIP